MTKHIRLDHKSIKKFTKEDYRNIVVLAEIIGKPKSLKYRSKIEIPKIMKTI